MAPTAREGRRNLLLVAGAGRSGTSLVTGLVGRLGVHVPSPEVTADASNPKGFGEPRWAVDFHNGLLKAVNVSAEDGRPEAWEITAAVAEQAQPQERLAAWLEEQLSIADRVVVKDPRLAWFLDLYTRVAREMDVEVSVLTMLRHPAESVKSRELAYGTKSSPATRMASWLNMMLGAELRSRAMPRAVIRYDELLADWRTQLGLAESRLGVPLLGSSTPEQEAVAASLVDPSLRRAGADWASLELPAQLQDLAERSYSGLQALTEDTPGTATDAGAHLVALDALRTEYQTMYDNAADLTRSRVRAARAEERRKGRPAPAPQVGRFSQLLSRARR